LQRTAREKLRNREKGEKAAVSRAGRPDWNGESLETSRYLPMSRRKEKLEKSQGKKKQRTGKKGPRGEREGGRTRAHDGGEKASSSRIQLEDQLSQLQRESRKSGREGKESGKHHTKGTKRKKHSRKTRAAKTTGDRLAARTSKLSGSAMCGDIASTHEAGKHFRGGNPRRKKKGMRRKEKGNAYREEYKGRAK